MYDKIDVLKLLPDRPGRGGAKFGYHSFQQEPINDTREVKNVHVWQDSRRSDRAGIPLAVGYNFPDDEAIGTDSVSAIALHGYAKFSLSDPTAGPSTHVLGHNTHVSYGGHIFDYTSYTNGTYGGGVWTGTTNVVCAASPTAPAVFANIGNRCFIGRGNTQGVIYDASRVSDFATDGPPKVYTIGVGQPTVAPTVVPAGTLSTAPVYLRKTSPFLSWPDPLGALGNVTTPGSGDVYGVTGDGVTWATGGVDAFNIVNKTTVFSSALMTVSIPNGSNIATFDPPLSIPPDSEWVGLKLTVNGFEFVMLYFGNHSIAGDPTLAVDECKLDRRYNNGTLPDIPEGTPGGDDPARDIVAAEFTVTGVRVTMQDTGVDQVWNGGPSGVNTHRGLFLDAGTSSGAGSLTWDETPPSYAYAWYDPVTGHISNISPIFAPTATSQTDVGVAISVDVGAISYPPSTSLIGGTRWTHILFFRTLMAGGSTLYPIGSLDPDSSDWRGLPSPTVTAIPPTGTNNIWADTARDADLLQSGALRAPQWTNNKPRIIQNGVESIITPAHMAYWDGRLWVAGPQDPAALHYSCDRTQCPFGIPEESFPDTNVLRIPAADGCVRGLRLIGEQLLITTERWAYTIAGNNESNYRLVRISTRMGGVGEYQMDEFVSDVEGGGALIVFVGTDARVYAMPLGGQAVCISKEIQTYLDSANLQYRARYALVRVHAMSVAGRRLCLVYVPSASGGPGKTFIYDFDSKVWAEHTMKRDGGTDVVGYGVAWATIPSTAEHSTEVYATPDTDTVVPISPNPIITLRSWLAPPTTTPIPSGYVRTFPLNFDGKKTRKQLHFVRIYVNDQSGTSVDPGSGATTYGWRVTVRRDLEATGLTMTPVPEYDAAYMSFPSGSVPVDSSTAAELIATDAALSPDTPILGYRFDIQVTFPGQTNKLYQLYRVDIGWSTASNGQEDP